MARREPLLLVALLTIVSGCTAIQTTTEPIKSPNDSRDYRFVELPNKLKVLLIHDADADKAAAALLVRRGSHHDPLEHAGLAHFTEHMLFLGTQKYPATDGYMEFISTHGGSTNAYTANDHTNYHFDIDPTHLAEALDRFSQFFIAPLLDGDYVSREKNAVHSEYQLQLRDDGWRSSSVRRVLVNPEHPGSRFNIGSLDTLASTTRTDVIEFLESNYSADQMALVVLSHDGLDSLETLVSEYFGAIENRDIGPAPTPPAMQTPRDTPVTMTFRTIKDIRHLRISFPIPPIDPHYRDKPTAHISNLLGHEGEGSLHALLKERGWIGSLAAGPNRWDETNATLGVSMSLTTSGAEHVEEIVNLVFQYIDAVRRDGMDAWRYDEQASVLDIGFRFQEKGSPLGTVRAYAQSLTRYEPEDILRAPYMMERYDPDLIRTFASRMTRNNAIIEISGVDVDADSTERWFEVPYALRRGPVAETPVTATFQMPEPNPYLPADFSLASADSPTLPIELNTDSPAQLWHAVDTEFGTPRAVVNLDIHVPGGLHEPADLVRGSLLTRLVQDSLNAKAYPAQIAGLQYRVRGASTGFTVSTNGYDDNLSLLFDDVLTAFASLQIDPARLAIHKDQMAKSYRNFASERPYSQAMAAIRHIAQSNSWPPSVLLAALDDVTAQSLGQWRRSKLDAVNATLFVYGNVLDSEALVLLATTRRHLNIVDVEPVHAVPRILDATYRHEVEIDHDDAAYVLYLQGEGPAMRERAHVGLLAQMLRPQFFNSLRTEQQLGYVVSVAPALIRDHPGIAFMVQSPVAGPAQLEAATALFLETQRTWIQEMPDHEIDEHKSGLIARLAEADQNLFARSRRLLLDLDFGVTTFDSRAQLTAEVAKIDRASLLATYDRLTAESSDNRLTIYSRGQFDEDIDAGTEIESIVNFKRGR